MANVVRTMILASIVVCATAWLVMRHFRSRQRHPAPAAPGVSVAAEAPGAVITVGAPSAPTRRRHDNSGFSHFSANHRGYRQMPRRLELKKRPPVVD
ncbi:putative lipid-binding transport protein (Tim44 family) [Actinoplanes tereljensis]|uniref:hypothetical protein n=1 Tax=Paractinoplanes tereljensis TaxID=571912 RepID=UPI001944C4CF|nr:hypothetical protein [Actinoplanes tereljensis]